MPCTVTIRLATKWLRILSLGGNDLVANPIITKYRSSSTLIKTACIEIPLKNISTDVREREREKERDSQSKRFKEHANKEKPSTTLPLDPLACNKSDS